MPPVLTAEAAISGHSRIGSPLEATKCKVITYFRTSRMWAKLTSGFEIC